MTTAKVRMFLHERDRAYARGDVGIIRSMNAELRRLNVPDTATLANPAGRPRSPSKAVEAQNGGFSPENGAGAPTAPGEAQEDVATDASRNKGGRPKLPRCEHENVSERCEICNPELAAK